jgi:hypothetical protein
MCPPKPQSRVRPIELPPSRLINYFRGSTLPRQYARPSFLIADDVAVAMQEKKKGKKRKGKRRSKTFETKAIRIFEDSRRLW